MQRTGPVSSWRLVLFVLAVGALLTVQAAGLTFTVEDRSVAPNSSVVVQIAVTDAQDLGGADLVLVYDPAVLRFASVAPGSLADRARVTATESGPGRVAIALASPRSLTGTGPVAALTFAAVGPSGARSSIALESVRSVSVDGDPVSARAVNGTVTVGGGPQTPLSPCVATGALAASAAWLRWLRRGREGPDARRREERFVDPQQVSPNESRSSW